MRHPLGTAVRAVVSWIFAIAIAIAMPGLAYEYVWSLWGLLAGGTVAVIALWSVIVAMIEWVSGLGLDDEITDTPYSMRFSARTKLRYKTTMKCTCASLWDVIIDEILGVMPWRWAFVTTVIMVLFAISAIVQSTPIRVSMLGLSLGFLALFYLLSAVTETILLIFGLILRANASCGRYTRIGRSCIPCHEGRDGESGILKSNDSPQPQQGSSMEKNVIRKANAQDWSQDSESVAQSSQLLYEYVQRALFEASGLRPLSYILVGSYLLIHAIVQLIVGVFDYLTGLFTGWAFCSCAAVRQQSAFCQCFRALTNPVHKLA